VHGRYALYETLGVGAAATVHLGVARGPELAPVAIKVLHDRQAREAGAVARLLDEVRLSRHVVHPNVVRVLDFVSDGEETLAVMEYVHGEPLSRLLADVKEGGRRTPVPIAVAIARDVLRGLYAAHIAKDNTGRALELVHRDVTPENILVGADGVARLMDFGVAKAQGRLHATKDGGVKGKLAYLAPEQVGGDVTARTDLYAAGLVLWEMLVGERVIDGESEPELLVKALDPVIVAPSTRVPEVPAALDAVVLRALCKEPEGRFATGTEQAEALERAVPRVAPASEVAEWVRVHGGTRLAKRDEAVRAMLALESSGRQESAPVPYVDAPRPADSGLRGMIVMGVAALAVVSLGLLYNSSTATGTGTAGTGTAGTGTAGTGTEPSASAPPSLPLVSPVPVPVPVPDPSAVTVVPTPASSPSPRPSSRPRPTVRAGAAPPSCDPPWYLDAKGIRRYDPACVK
jgi:serine/threonine-protein kinase